VPEVFTVGPGGLTLQPVVNGTRTMLEVIAAASHPLTLRQFGVSFNGASAAAGILCELCFLTATGTGTTANPRAHDQQAAGTISATAKYNDTVEPTVGHVILPFYVPPSQFDRFVPPIDDIYLAPVGSGWGLRFTSVTGNLPTCLPFFVCSEN
jgi:hypothetical protein